MWTLRPTKHQGEQRGQEKEKSVRDGMSSETLGHSMAVFPKRFLGLQIPMASDKRRLCCAHSDTHPLVGPGRMALGDPSYTHGCCISLWPGRVS